MLVISCHADTGFASHRLRRRRGGVLVGHLDNFVGVHAVMMAYFSGRLDQDCVRIELTHGEEKGLLGAREVCRTLDRDDVVAVVDVTGTRTRKAVCIEKCRDAELRAFLRRCLRGLSYVLYEGCPDPVSTVDEVDVYCRRCRRTFFLGIPVQGGDYNAGVVRCRQRSIDAAAEAVCRIAEGYEPVEKVARPSWA
jgi:hypothetical protein